MADLGTPAGGLPKSVQDALDALRTYGGGYYQGGYGPVPQPQPPRAPALEDFGQRFRSAVLTRPLPFLEGTGLTVGDILPVEGGAQPNPDFYRPLAGTAPSGYDLNTYQRPITGGIARVLTSPLAQKIQPQVEDIGNPLFALGALGEAAGPVEPAVAALGQYGKRLVVGARELTSGKLPQFATENAGMARIDLGAGGGLPESPRLGENLAQTAENLSKTGVPQSAEQAAAQSGVVTDAQRATAQALADEIAARSANLSAGAADAPRTLYHGSGTPGLTPEAIDVLRGDPERLLLGNGIYLTDNPSVAGTYATRRAAKTGTPTIYEARAAFRRVLDAEAPIAHDVRSAVESSLYPDVRDALNAPDGATFAQFYKAVREATSEVSRQSMTPGSEYVEQFQDILDALRKSGYDAIRYRGGVRTGNVEHEAFVALDPSSIKSFQPSDWAARSATPQQVVDNLGVTLGKLDTTPEVKDYIAQVAKDNAGFEAQRRGVVSIDETLADAAKQMDAAQKYAYLKPGTALNAEDLTALKGAMVKKGEEVIVLQDKVRAAAAAGIRSDELDLRMYLAAQEHAALQQSFAGARAESGRALRIQREITGALNTGTGTAYDRAIQAIGGRQNMSALVDRLQRIWTDPAVVDKERATFQFIQNLDRPTIFDHINEYWLNSILSSAVTHVVNVSGQTALQVADAASKFVSAGIEAVSTAGGLRRPRERFFSEAWASAFGGFSGLGEGFQRAGAMLRNGITPEMMTKFRETGDIARREANPGWLNAPTRLLGAEDQVFYAFGYSRGLHEFAARIAAREKQGIFSGAFGRRVAELLANPTEEMLAAADAMGKRAGLRDSAGVGASKIIGLRDLNVLGGLSEKTIRGKAIGEFQPLRFVVPFVNTPMRLLEIGTEYSPLGLVRAIGATGAERSDILARATLGSMGMAWVAQQYANGIITGAAPTGSAEKDAFYRSGKIPYAVNIGGTWYSFARLEPIATPLKWASVLMDAWKNGQNGNQPPDVVAGKMAGALASAFTDATYLSGFSALIDAIKDPERSAPKFFAQIAGGFVPATVRTAVQSTDPFIRKPNGIIEQIESTLPLLNEQVPVRQTVFGNPATRTQGKQGIAGVLSPVDFNAARPTPIDDKLATFALPDLIGPDGRSIPVRQLMVGFVAQDIANYKLTPDEGFRYQQYAGRATENLLTALFDDKRPYNGVPFSKLAQVDQIRAIKSTISDAREIGRAQVADEIVSSSSDDAALSRATDMRLSTIPRLRDQATYIEGLQRQGKLTLAVRQYLDTHKGVTDPTVNDYLKVAPVLRQFLSLDPYNIGNPAEWAALDQAKMVMSAFIKVSPPPPGWSQIDWFQYNDPQHGSLVRRYSYENVRNYQRVTLLRQHPELSRFVTTTAPRQTKFTTP